MRSHPADCLRNDYPKHWSTISVEAAFPVRSPPLRTLQVMTGYCASRVASGCFSEIALRLESMVVPTGKYDSARVKLAFKNALRQPLP